MLKKCFTTAARGCGGDDDATAGDAAFYDNIHDKRYPGKDKHTNR